MCYWPRRVKIRKATAGGRKVLWTGLEKRAFSRSVISGAVYQMCAFAPVRKSHLAQQLQLESPLGPFKNKYCHSLRPRGLWHSLPVLVELSGGVGGETTTLGASQALERYIILSSLWKNTFLMVPIRPWSRSQVREST